MSSREFQLARFCPVCRGTGGIDLVCSACHGNGHLARNPYPALRRSPALSRLLVDAMQATGAKLGNVQLYDASKQTLRLVAHQGFKPDFLTFFDTVNGNESACGTAMNEKSRIVVIDARVDPIYSDVNVREAMLRADVRSLQSTPILDQSGSLIGVVSTHYSESKLFGAGEFKELDRLVAKFATRARLSFAAV